MKEFIFKKMDAFATMNSDGNTAGGIYLNSKDRSKENIFCLRRISHDRN